MKIIDPLSAVPLLIYLDKGGKMSGTGTCFIVEKAGRSYLITNWHVVTGRHPDTGKPLDPGAADPDGFSVYLHDAKTLGGWTKHQAPLLQGQSKLWLEHPQGRDVDVVAIPITVPASARAYPMDLSLRATDIVVAPSEPVSIIGFPYGTASAGKFPIWKTGHVASDIDLNYGGLPVFLIDATGRPGMSGSPVVARRIGFVHTSQGFAMGGDAIRFLGIFSGSIQLGSEIGMVWKPEVLDAILP